MFSSQRAHWNPQLGAELVQFIGATTTSLDCAIYDLRLPDVIAALSRVAGGRGKRLRIAYDGATGTAAAIHQAHLDRYATALHPTGGHLMHNKFVVRDGKAVWTGSANFTPGGFDLQDNNCMIAESAQLARQYGRYFDQLLTPQTFFAPASAPTSVAIDGFQITPYFTTTAAVEGIETAVINALKGARRVLILAMLISDPGILDALKTLHTTRGVDVRGVIDPNEMKSGHAKASPNPNLYWFMHNAKFRLAKSHAFKKGGEQDFMHNKVMIIDGRVVITGSYNFSENAEANDENLLIIDSPQVADAYTTYFNAVYNTARPAH